MRVLGCLSLLFALAACQTTGDDAPRSSPLAARPDRVPEIPGYTFAGCQLDAGECFNACESHRFFPMTGDSGWCGDQGKDDGPYECHCLAPKSASEDDNMDGSSAQF